MGALDGLKIADFSWVGAGPRATKDLADNGARVVKIESARRLDLGRLQNRFLLHKARCRRDVRHCGPDLRGLIRSPIFQSRMLRNLGSLFLKSIVVDFSIQHSF